MTSRLFFKKLGLLLGLLILIIVETLGIIKPAIYELSAALKEKIKLAEQIKQIDSRVKDLEKISSDKTKIEQLKNLSVNWLPKEVNQQDFVLRINQLASNNGTVLETLAVTIGKEQSLDYEIKLNGSYQSIHNFIKGTNTLTRLIAVQEIFIKTLGQQNQAVIKGKTFFRPPPHKLDSANQKLSDETINFFSSLVTPGNPVSPQENPASSAEPFGTF